MGASAIADALVTMLSAASVFGSNGVSKDDYGILGRTSGSCAVIEFLGLEGMPDRMGGGYEHGWSHEIAAFVKDTGNSQLAMRRVYAVTDAVVNCIMSDQKLQGTAQRIDRIRAEREPREALEVGGARWLPVFFEVVAVEWE